MVTEQGIERAHDLPDGFKRNNDYGFQVLGVVDKPLVEWLREYFPADREPELYKSNGDFMERFEHGGLARYEGRR